MRKSIITEIVILIVCALTAVLLAVLLCDFTPSEDLSVKIFNIGTETSPRYMVYIFWLLSIFIVNSLRQIKLKYKSIISNIVLLLVSLRLLLFVYGRIESVTRLKHAILADQRNPTNNNNFLYLLWTILIILLITIIIILFSFQKSVRQRMSSDKAE